MADAEIPEAFECLFDMQYRDIALYGGRGGAKTHSVGGALVIQAAQSPLRIVCAREIQNSLKESSKQLLEDKIEAYGLKRSFTITDNEIRGRNGSLFMFKGMWRNPDAIKSLEGADVFWGDEANRFSERSIRLVRPTMRKPGSRMIWTWNREFDHDPIDRLFLGEHGPPPRSYVRQVGWRDNPYFKDSPLYEEMLNDYDKDAATAEHVWGGGYVTAIEGAYFAKQLAEARADGRISSAPIDPLMQIRTFWDLGHRDSTAIWVAQFVGREVRVLDYIEASGQVLGYYVNELTNRGYGPGKALCVLPHDGSHVHANNPTGSSYEEQLMQAGFDTQVIKNQGKGAAMLRIEAARRLFPSIWFNEETTRDGIKALSAYHERRDEKRNAGLGPEHDWSSHGSDAFGLMCIAYEEPRTAKRPRAQHVVSWMG